GERLRAERLKLPGSAVEVGQNTKPGGARAMSSPDRLHADARILIVDDQEANVLLLERLLSGAGYGAALGITDPRRVPDLVMGFRPDLILLDLRMPELDGFGVLQLLRALVPPGSFLPVLVLTADVSPDTKLQA